MKKEKRARARRTGAQAAESGAARPAGGAGKTLRALGFAQKLTLAMLLVLAMALSLGGAVVLAGNFDDALNEAGQQAEVQHLLQCYALESDLLDVAARGETVTDSHLARYGSSLEDYVGGKLVALYRGDAAAQGGTSSAAAETETEAEAQAASDAERQPAALRTVYTSFPWDEGPTGQTDTYRMHRDGGRTYMLFEAEVETVGNPPVTLLTGHDVTSVFAARDRAMLRFWEMELVVLVCAGAMIALLSQEKVDALELSVRQREDFMSAFTHELKTPMTAVIGYADTLRSMQCEPEQQQRAANYIFSEARRVEALSEKLLQLLGLREQAPALEPLELERVFARARAALGPSVAPVEPVFQPAPGVRVRGDADLLVDLLYNLVQNAARARPKDGRVSIGWHTAAEGQGVDVTVRDTGCGIPAAALARVTEPFYMVDKSRARAGGGSGMGLALCEKIAALHGGRLQIESVEGEGTAVTVRLPAADGKEGGAAV